MTITLYNEYYFGSSQVPIVSNDIRKHHQRLRLSYHEGSLNLEAYTQSLKKAIQNYSVQKHEQLQWYVFYKKLIALYQKEEIVLRYPDNDALGWNSSEINGDMLKKQKQDFECECRQMDSALPFILEEYKHMDKLEILLNNYQFNVFRSLALRLDEPNWTFSIFSMEVLTPIVTFILQASVVIAFFNSAYLFDGVSMQTSIERLILLISLVIYMLIFFIKIECQQIRMTKKLVNNPFNVGFILDVTVNFVLYMIIIGIQIIIMLKAENSFDLVANSIILLFITKIDDELNDLSDVQELDLVMTVIATKIFTAVSNKTNIRSYERPDMICMTNSELTENVSNIIIPYFEWNGPGLIDFGHNLAWKANNWDVDLIKSRDNRLLCMRVKNENLVNAKFSGPGAKYGDEMYKENKETGFVVSLGKGGFFLRSDWSTRDIGHIEILEEEPAYKPEKQFHWVTELPCANEVTVLHSTSDNHFRGIVFLVKLAQNTDTNLISQPKHTSLRKALYVI